MVFESVEIIKIVPGAIAGLTIHEFAHAYAAYCLGDSTAKEEGRLTLNPLKHIDWIGLLLIIAIGFGWAKPVSFNPNQLKKKHRDEIIIALAGPISNLLLAVAMFILIRILTTQTSISENYIQLLFSWGVINVGLFVFNLLPLPPLDGSHIYLTYLQDINPKLMMNLYRYGSLALFAIIMIENNFNINILHLSDAIVYLTRFIYEMMQVK